MSGRLKRTLAANLVAIVSIIGLFTLALGVGYYILQQQRLRFPFVDPQPFALHAEFSTAQAVIPGQGQTLQLAGVRVGDVTGVKLRDGRAVITFEVDKKYAPMIRTDGHLLLRPKTGLKDMIVELDPGNGAPVPENFTFPVSNTLPDVNTDEIFATLDADTRDHLKVLLRDGSAGLKGNGEAFSEVLRRLRPTHRDLARVSTAVARRQTSLRRLVRELRDINVAVAGEDQNVSRLVDKSSQVFRAFASEEDGIRTTLRGLPPALEATTGALDKVGRFARVLTPAADKIRPVARALAKANRETAPAAREVAPLLRDDVRPFVRELRPLVRDLRPASTQLAAASPPLRRTFKGLNSLTNLLAYNQDGREGPDDPNRDEGYLFWLAWVNHLATGVFSTADAHGPFRAVALSLDCDSAKANVEGNPASEFLLNLTPLLLSPACDGKTLPKLGPAAARSKAAR